MNKNITNNKTIIFLGAGFDAAIGMPTWKKLFEEYFEYSKCIIKDNKKEKKNFIDEIKSQVYSYSKKISLLELKMEDYWKNDVIKKEYFQKYKKFINVKLNFLKSRFSYNKIKNKINESISDEMNKFKDILNENNNIKILTTNISDTMEKFFKLIKDEKLQKNGSYFPLHGTILEIGSIVLGEDSYLEKSLEKSKRLENLLSGKNEHDNIIIFGYSMNDFYIASLIKTLKNKNIIIFIYQNDKEELAKLTKKYYEKIFPKVELKFKLIEKKETSSIKELVDYIKPKLPSQYKKYQEVLNNIHDQNKEGENKEKILSVLKTSDIKHINFYLEELIELDKTKHFILSLQKEIRNFLNEEFNNKLFYIYYYFWIEIKEIQDKDNFYNDLKKIISDNFEKIIENNFNLNPYLEYKLDYDVAKKYTQKTKEINYAINYKWKDPKYFFSLLKKKWFFQTLLKNTLEGNLNFQDIDENIHYKLIEPNQDKIREIIRKKVVEMEDFINCHKKDDSLEWIKNSFIGNEPDLYRITSRFIKAILSEEKDTNDLNSPRMILKTHEDIIKIINKQKFIKEYRLIELRISKYKLNPDVEISHSPKFRPFNNDAFKPIFQNWNKEKHGNIYLKDINKQKELFNSLLKYNSFSPYIYFPITFKQYKKDINIDFFMLEIENAAKKWLKKQNSIEKSNIDYIVKELLRIDKPKIEKWLRKNDFKFLGLNSLEFLDKFENISNTDINILMDLIVNEQDKNDKINPYEFKYTFYYNIIKFILKSIKTFDSFKKDKLKIINKKLKWENIQDIFVKGIIHGVIPDIETIEINDPQKLFVFFEGMSTFIEFSKIKINDNLENKFLDFILKYDFKNSESNRMNWLFVEFVHRTNRIDDYVNIIDYSSFEPEGLFHTIINKSYKNEKIVANFLKSNKIKKMFAKRAILNIKYWCSNISKSIHLYERMQLQIDNIINSKIEFFIYPFQIQSIASFLNQQKNNDNLQKHIIKNFKNSKKDEFLKKIDDQCTSCKKDHLDEYLSFLKKQKLTIFNQIMDKFKELNLLNTTILKFQG